MAEDEAAAGAGVEAAVTERAGAAVGEVPVAKPPAARAAVRGVDEVVVKERARELASGWAPAATVFALPAARLSRTNRACRVSNRSVRIAGLR